MQISFGLPVPVNEGCILTVVLPEQYNLNNVKSVAPSKFFGEYIQMLRSNGDVILDYSTNSFSIYPCKDYKENVQDATIFVQNL